MSHFLSIDLDFWQCPVNAQESVLRVMEFVKKRAVPILVVMNHQQMLREVNRSSARTLVNIDAHSDLGHALTTSLNCGTWVSYVKWRRNGKYFWIRADPDPSQGKCNYLRRWNEGTDWKRTSSRTATLEARCADPFLTRDLVGVGICLSPTFTRSDVYDAIRPILRGLPYRKGRRDENSMWQSKRAYSILRVKKQLQAVPGARALECSTETLRRMQRFPLTRPIEDETLSKYVAHHIIVEAPTHDHAVIRRLYPSAKLLHWDSDPDMNGRTVWNLD